MGLIFCSHKAFWKSTKIHKFLLVEQRQKKKKKASYCILIEKYYRNTTNIPRLEEETVRALPASCELYESYELYNILKTVFRWVFSWKHCRVACKKQTVSNRQQTVSDLKPTIVFLYAFILSVQDSKISYQIAQFS